MKFVFCILLLFNFLASISQHTEKSIRDHMQIIDSIALHIDSAQSFIEFKMEGGSNVFGVY